MVECVPVYMNFVKNCKTFYLRNTPVRWKITKSKRCQQAGKIWKENVTVINCRHLDKLYVLKFNIFHWNQILSTRSSNQQCYCVIHRFLLISHTLLSCSGVQESQLQYQTRVWTVLRTYDQSRILKKVQWNLESYKTKQNEFFITGI